MDGIIQELYSGKYPLIFTDCKIILCILYNTDYGKRIGAELSLNNISRDIGVSKRMVAQELKKLIELKIVRVVENYSSEDRYGRVLAINQPSKWKKGR